MPGGGDQRRRSRGSSTTWTSSGGHRKASGSKAARQADEADRQEGLADQPGVVVHDHGGYAPEQWEGEVDGHSFSFRERDTEWDIEIDLHPSGRFMRVVDGTHDDGTTRYRHDEISEGDVIATGTTAAQGYGAPARATGRRSSSPPSEITCLVGNARTPGWTRSPPCSAPRPAGAPNTEPACTTPRARSAEERLPGRMVARGQRIRRARRRVPLAVLAGSHLCRGDAGHRRRCRTGRDGHGRCPQATCRDRRVERVPDRGVWARLLGGSAFRAGRPDAARRLGRLGQALVCERAVADLLARVPAGEDRRTLTAYATWRIRAHRRARSRPTSTTVTGHATLRLRAATALLEWLRGNGIRLSELRQADCRNPEPLARFVRAHLDAPRRHINIAAAPPNSTWLFPGHLPGQPITPSRIGQRLAHLGIDCQTGRRAAMLELARTVPAAVLADLLGIHTTTAADWAHAAGGDWSHYAAEIARTRTSPCPTPSSSQCDVIRPGVSGEFLGRMGTWERSHRGGIRRS